LRESDFSYWDRLIYIGKKRNIRKYKYDWEWIKMIATDESL
jgi:hypothetical protein